MASRAGDRYAAQTRYGSRDFAVSDQEGNWLSFGTYPGRAAPRLTNGLTAWPQPAPPPETVRNYRPKTGNESETAANIIGFIGIFADEQHGRPVWCLPIDDLREQLYAEKWRPRPVFAV